MQATKDGCDNEGYNLNALGKSRPHWSNIQRIVQLNVLRRELRASQAEVASKK
jgi:hypothetical protein